MVSFYKMEPKPTYVTSLIVCRQYSQAGAAAGLVVDISLFPLDTIKTRLQSSAGFNKSGGFTRLYKGLRPAVVGSAPTASLFFCTYDVVSRRAKAQMPEQYHPVVHMGAACSAEVVSCLAKVPTEVVKQRMQAFTQATSPLAILRAAVRQEGFRGLYRGFTSTVLREIPFSLVQFPLWEFLKLQLCRRKGRELNVLDVAACGALAGGVSAGVTTPLDVAKTRIMLAEANSVKSRRNFKVLTVMRDVYEKVGVRGLFAGFVPRVTWISVGGAVFFGTYEATKTYCISYPWGRLEA